MMADVRTLDNNSLLSALTSDVAIGNDLHAHNWMGGGYVLTRHIPTQHSTAAAPASRPRTAHFGRRTPISSLPCSFGTQAFGALGRVQARAAAMCCQRAKSGSRSLPDPSLDIEIEPAPHAAGDMSAFGREPRDPPSLLRWVSQGHFIYLLFFLRGSGFCVFSLVSHYSAQSCAYIVSLCMERLTGLNLFTSVIIWACTSWIWPHITFTWTVSFPRLSNHADFQ